MEKEVHDIQALWSLLQNNLQEELSLIEKEETQTTALAHRAILVATEYLQRAIASITAYTFLAQEEILFYKTIKPYFYARLIYYGRLLTIERDRPAFDTEALQQFYLQQLVGLNKIYEEHKFIKTYLQNGQHYLDHQLFFRQADQNILAMNAWWQPIDGAYHLSYDRVVAELLSTELLEKYVLDRLSQLAASERAFGPLPKITFTAPKAHFVELAYGLFAAGVFNNGKASLKDIIDTLEIACNIKSGNPSRIFQEILYRHSGPSVFHDFVKSRYLLYINRIEDKHIG